MWGASNFGDAEDAEDAEDAKDAEASHSGHLRSSLVIFGHLRSVGASFHLFSPLCLYSSFSSM